MGQFKRKTPFSGKKKKVQLKEQKQRRAGKFAEDQQEANGLQGAAGPSVGGVCPQTSVMGGLAGDRYSTFTREVTSINQQPRGRGGGGGRNRFNLQFSSAKLNAEHEKGRMEMYADIDVAEPGALEYTSQHFFPDGLTFPERPEGYQTMTKEQLDMLENKSVRLYGEEMERLFSAEDINLYEQNVETWKQLWRVFDKSDVLLFIVDIRFAVAQFPPYVYRRLAVQGRGVLLVLNKVDLVPASVVLAWKQYFENLCPGLQVVPFCSHECVADRQRKMRLALHSCRGLVAAVERAAPRAVDLSSWKEQLEREALISPYDCGPIKPDRRRKHKFNADEEEYDEDDDQPETDDDNAKDDEAVPDEGADVQGAGRVHRAFTIGTIGYPNVGKSSLINAIMGKYKVSVSQTPGHTKHFQTHYLTPTKDLMLCDCPGLIFPAICPYKLQVLSGTFPISQVRCPMSVVGFLASHINITRVLGLKPPSEQHPDPLNNSLVAKWTPYTISEAWALKRQYHVKGRGGRLDTSRAANELLRMSLNAKNNLVLGLHPKGYHSKKVALEAMSEQITAIRQVQGVHATELAHLERVLSFDPIPRGTKPSDSIAEDTGSSGRRSKVKSGRRRGMRKELLSSVGEENDVNEESEQDEEIEEEPVDDDQEEEDTDEPEESSEEEGDDQEVPQTAGARRNYSKGSVVVNKFAALDLLRENSE